MRYDCLLNEDLFFYRLLNERHPDKSDAEVASPLSPQGAPHPPPNSAPVGSEAAVNIKSIPSLQRRTAQLETDQSNQRRATGVQTLPPANPEISLPQNSEARCRVLPSDELHWAGKALHE